MAKKKRRGRTPPAGAQVYAVEGMTALLSTRFGVGSDLPTSYHIPAGTPGVCRGKPGKSPHIDVDFHFRDGTVAPVEVMPGQIERARG